jgi:hypothetical protein
MRIGSRCIDMKIFNTVIALALGCSALAQDGTGPAIRSSGGRGTNTTFFNATNIGITTLGGTSSISSFAFRTNQTERIYAVESWGALGDGVETLNASMSAGSPSLTNTTATFPTDIAGKSFTMYGAGTNGWNLSGVILARVSATVLTLSTNATISQTNRFVYGTDDMSAINLAHDWLATNGLGGTLGYTPGKIYCLGTNLLDPGTPTNHYNAQLRIPYVVQTAGAPTIRITGFQKPSGTYDNNGSGRSAVIWSFYPRGPDGSNVASVLTVNSLTGSTVGNLKQRMNRARFVVDNIIFRHAHDNNMRILDLYAAQQANGHSINFESGYGSTGTEPPVQTGTNGFALIAPNSVNYNENRFDDIAFYGQYNGISPCGAMQGNSWQFYYTVNCIQPFDSVIRSTLSHVVSMECSNLISLPSTVMSADISGVHLYNSTRFTATRNLIFAPQNSFCGTLIFAADNPVINTRLSTIGDVSKALILQVRGDYPPISYTPILSYSNIVSSNNIVGRAAMIGSFYSGGATYGAFGNTNGQIGLIVGTAGDNHMNAASGQSLTFWNNGIGTGTSIGSAAANLWTFGTAINVTSGRITNGNSVWFDRTNSSPPSDVNHSYFATSTNAPGSLFGWNGSAWVAIDDVIDQWQFTTPFANEALVLTNSVTLTNAMTIQTNSWIGIGLTNPGAQLDIKGNGTGRIMMGSPGIGSGYSGISFNGTLNAANYAFLGGVGDNSSYFSRPSGGSIIFREANGSDQVTIMSGGRLSPNVGVFTNASGFKHARISTGSIVAGSTAPITNTWVTAFADANYTVSASVVDSTASSLSLSVVHIDSVTTTNVVVRVLNNAIGSLTGVLHLIAIHD